MSIKGRLTVLVTICTLFTLVMGATALFGINGLSKSVEAVQNKGVLRTRDLARAQDAIWKLRFGIAQYLAVPDPVSRKKIIDESPKWFEAIDASLKDYGKDLHDEGTREALAKLLDIYGQYKQARPHWFELMEQGKLEEAGEYRSKTILISGAGTVKALESLIDLQAKGSDKAALDAQTTARNWMLAIAVVGFVSFLCVVISASLIGTGISRPLRAILDCLHTIREGDLRKRCNIDSRDELGEVAQGVNKTSEALAGMVGEISQLSSLLLSSSHDILATSQEIATGAERAAAQIGNVATASEEMATTSNDIARNCALAADTSQHTAQSAHDGAAVVNESIAGMSAIAERVRQTSVAIASLGTRSDQIGDIVATIEDIADQTNLLALNAAIEAARAGEQGRGFAVVADEVRALAERTTRATREIGDMIKAIQTETRSAVKAMEEGVREVEKGTSSSQRSGEALTGILASINEVTDQINQIAIAAEEQTATTAEVTDNIQQATEVVMLSSQGAGRTAASASGLAEQAQKLQGLVRQFRV